MEADDDIMIKCQNNMRKFLKEIKRYRTALQKNRKRFWDKNKKDFGKNVCRIIEESKKPKGWKIYVVASSFEPAKKIFPFDHDAWSSTNVVAASKNQGFEVMMFFNRAGGEFLSRSALLPLVLHELWHVQQIAKSSKDYIKSITDYKI